VKVPELGCGDSPGEITTSNAKVQGVAAVAAAFGACPTEAQISAGSARVMASGARREYMALPPP
jgi:hypothetical protein